MLLPIFTLQFGQKMIGGRVTLGEYDGQHPCITAATTAEKVFIHNPHQRMGHNSGRMVANQGNQELSMLNINQRVLSLTAGQLSNLVNRDTLVVGTPTNILAYDVENNSDVFYKEAPDGANAVAIGNLGTREKPLAIVGGNCSIQGFDYEGNDPFWTVTGDNVTSLILTDYSKDGNNELIVGSEDFEIRIFAEDEIISEITETESVTALTPVQDGRFAYALSNGTVGVYEKTTRWWRIKSKNQATSIFSFDLDGDGVKEMITGWSSGKLDARNDKSGEVIFKDNMSSSIAGILEGDYRMDGKMELITCGADGEVRGYLPAPPDVKRNLMDLNLEQETLRELSSRKQNLLLELRNYETNEKESSRAPANPNLEKDVGMIPAQTQLQTALAINMGSDGKEPHVEVTLSTSNKTVIRAVLIFAEGIFEGESHVVHPREAASTISVAILPPRDIPVDLHIKAFVGYAGSAHYHVFELTRQLPRFAMYSLVEGEIEDVDPPEGEVNFLAKERVQRITMWINQNFLLTDELQPASKLDCTFLCLRDSTLVKIGMEPTGQMKISTDNMEFAGDLIQSLGSYLGLEDLQSTAHFPADFNRLETLLVRTEELQSVRQKLSAEMADHSGIIRGLVIRAEDSRIMNDIPGMRKWYSQLHEVNRDLISGYKIRCNNHEQLMDTLKEVNQTIQRAGRLRLGKSKTLVVNESRNAIKDTNISQLIKVVTTGLP